MTRYGHSVATGDIEVIEAGHTDTGSFTTGPNGIVQVVVPLANIGSPAAAAVLTQPAGQTDTEEGVPPTPAGQSTALLEAVDSGGPANNYTVGSVCKAS